MHIINKANTNNHIFKKIKEENARLIEQDIREKRHILRALPTGIALGTDATCNLRCIMCWQRLEDQKKIRAAPTIEEKYLIKMAEQTFPTAERLQLNVSGEPLLSRRLDLEVDLAESYGVQLEIITNGTLLDAAKPKIKRLIRNSCSISFSFDSPIKKTYESIRIGADFNQVVKNMKLFQKFRNKLPASQRPYFHIMMVIIKNNIEEVPQMVRFAHDIGADTLHIIHDSINTGSIRGLSLEKFKTESNLILLSAELLARKLKFNVRIPSLYEVTPSRLEPKKTITHCPFLWKRAFIDANADIFTCCTYSYPIAGSLKKDDFYQIWNGKQYQMMRKNFTVGPNYKRCKVCVESGFLERVII